MAVMLIMTSVRSPPSAGTTQLACAWLPGIPLCEGTLHTGDFGDLDFHRHES
jgi:hypothetical protein